MNQLLEMDRFSENFTVWDDEYQEENFTHWISMKNETEVFSITSKVYRISQKYPLRILKEIRILSHIAKMIRHFLDEFMFFTHPWLLKAVLQILTGL